jgi:hypothetical protein
MNASCRRLLCVSLVGAAVLFSAAAHAQGPSARGELPLAQSLKGDAKDAYSAASALYKHGDFAAAETNYRQAYDLSKDPRLIFNMAACERGLHAYARMQALLERYKQEAGANISAEDRMIVDEALAALPKFVGTVVVNVNVEGAAVTVDGESVGSTPLATPIVLDAGRHTVVVRKDGYENVERPIEISAGTPSSLAVTLVVQVSAAPASTGEHVPPAPPPETPAAGRQWSPWVYAGFGLAGVGVVVGSVTGGLAISKGSSVAGQCEGLRCPTSVDGDLQSGRTLATVSTVSFIAAGVGAVGGVVALLLSPRGEKTAQTGVSVAPWASIGSAGVRGAF